MSTRVGLMGFGRIGRNVFRILHEGDHDVEVVAIVDIAEPESLEYLLRFDTVHGRFEEPVEVRGDSLVVRDRPIKMLNAKAPGDVDWAALGVEVVVEATGKYRTRQLLERHLARGAKRVVLTVPPRDAEIPIVIRGVNDAIVLKDTRIVSAASCTANALAPICKILDDAFGIDRAFMTTVHAYTNDQRLADVPHAEMRRSRAAAENIIPTETYAPRVVMGILPQLAGKLDGMGPTSTSLRSWSAPSPRRRSTRRSRTRPADRSPACSSTPSSRSSPPTSSATTTPASSTRCAPRSWLETSSRRSPGTTTGGGTPAASSS